MVVLIRGAIRRVRGGPPPVLYHRPSGVTWRFRIVPIVDDAGWLMLRVCRLLRIPAIASVHDVSPEHEVQNLSRRIAAGQTDRTSELARSMRRTARANAALQKYALPRSSIVLVTSTQHAEMLQRRILRLQPHRICLVPPGVRPDLVIDIPPRERRPQECVIGIPGSMFDSDVPRVEAALALLPESMEFVVRFGGRGAEISTGFSVPPNVRIEPVPQLMYAEFAMYAQEIDVFVLIWGFDPYFATTSPLRIPMCIASGRPVVSTPLPELAPAGFAPLVRLTSPEPIEIANAIAHAANDEASEQQAQRARSTVLASSSWDARFDAVVRALETLSA